MCKYFGRGRWALSHLPIERTKRAPIPKLKKVKPAKRKTMKRKTTRRAVPVKAAPKKQLPKKKRGWF